MSKSQAEVDHYRPRKPLPEVDLAKLPPGTIVKVELWKARPASEPGSPFPLPALPRGAQLVVTLPSGATQQQADYLNSVGLKSWGSGWTVWLGDVVQIPFSRKRSRKSARTVANGT